MACKVVNSCKGMGSCNSMRDHSVGMDKKRKDVLQGGKSKEAFNHNVATEVKAGKPVKQAVAIAYSEKRHTDLEPTARYKNSISQYGLSNMKDNGGADVNSLAQAKQLASARSGQSYNDNVRKFRNADRYGMRGKK